MENKLFNLNNSSKIFIDRKNQIVIKESES